MKKVLLLLVYLLPFTFHLLLPVSVFAQTSPLGGDGCTGDQLNTAIGCINISDQNSLIKAVLTFGIAIGGGVAFLLILYGSFIVMTSQGDPKRLAGGQETITSAVMGLILLIFSVFILRVIGLDILAIPGWG